MTTPLRLSMILTGDASSLKTAAASAKADIAGVSDSASRSSAATNAMTASTDKAAAALNREADAARKAAEEAKKLATARSQVSKFEVETREQTEKRLGLKPRQPLPSPSQQFDNAGTAAALSGQAAAEAGLRNKIGGYLGLGSKSTDSSIATQAKELAGYSRELDRVRGQYKPLLDAQQRHLSLLKEINTAAKIGAISEDQRVAATSQAQAAYAAQVSAIQTGGAATAKATALASHEVTNLSYQLNDIVVMLASGQSPFLMMMQQGGQVAQIMGDRGLGQILPALGQGLRTLITPTTLLMAGMTAVGYAASYVFDGLFTKTRKLSEVTSEHEQNIRKLRDAYKYAGTGADEYYRRASGGSRIASASTRLELEKAAQKDTQSFLSSVSVQTYGTGIFIVDPAYKEFADAIEHLHKTAKDGQPDLLGFRQLVEQRWNLEPNNEKLMKTGMSLLKLGEAGIKAAEQIEDSSLETLRTLLKLEDAGRRLDVFGQANTNLRGISALELSERRQAENFYATANGTASNRGERDDAYRQREAALSRIADQEQRQIELAKIDIQMQSARDPWTRAELAAKRERIQLSAMEIDAVEAETRVRQARDQVMAEAMAQSSAQIIDLRAEATARAKVNDALAAGTIEAADAEQYLRIESELRPLITAAARAEGDEKQRLLSIIAQMITGYQSLADEEKRSSALEYIQSQKDRIELMRAELQMVSASETERERMLSQLETEQDIRRRGLDISGAEANAMRLNTQLASDLRTELERQKDAWQTARSAGENAIDGIFDAIGNGDYKDALKNVALDITRTFSELAIKNPLKNALFGTNYGTLDDLLSPKSAGGILSGLTGGQSVGAMNVQAAIVNIGGTGIGGSDGLLNNVTRMLSASNSNGTGSNFGISHYAAAIRSIESAGSGGYGALGPILGNGDRAYGAYQVMGANIPSWTKSALGSSLSADQFLKSRSAQDAVFEKVFGGYVDKYGANGAAQAWFGGPGSVGRGGVTDILGTSGTEYVNKFNDALGKVTSTAGTTSNSLMGFTSNVGTAGNGLNQLGSGFNSFGQKLANVSVGGGGGLGGLLGTLFPNAGQFASNQLSNAISSGSWGLWDTGGYTGDGGEKDVAGFVHGKEFVVRAPVVAQPGVRSFLEALNSGRPGYMDGGYVASSGSSPVARFNQSANANRTGADSSNGRPRSSHFTINLDGARGDREIEAAAYRGMQTALREYDDGMPNRVNGIMQNPRWQ